MAQELSGCLHVKALNAIKMPIVELWLGQVK